MEDDYIYCFYMEKTTIFARTTKNLDISSKTLECQHCLQYKLEIGKLKEKLDFLNKTIQCKYPINGDVTIYDEKLTILNHKFVQLKKRLEQLDSQNQFLDSKYVAVKEENKKNVAQLRKYQKENQEINQLLNEKQNKETGITFYKGQEEQQQKKNKEKQQLKVQFKQFQDQINDLEKLLNWRERIQIQRHTEIERLGSIVRDINCS